VFTPEQYEELLKLSLDALRAARGGVASAAADLPAPAAAAPSLNDWLVTYREIIAGRGYDKQTIKNRRSTLAHVVRLWGERPMTALKPHEIATGIKSLSPANAVRVLGELRDVFNEAVANGAAEHNPAAHVKAPKHRGLRKRLTFETWRAMWELSKAGPQRWVESLLLLALVTGQRRADLAKWRFDDVFTDADGRQYLRVEQQKKAGKPIGARVEIPLTLRMDAIGLTVGEVIEHCRGSAKPGATLLRKAGGGPIEESSLSARFHEHLVAVVGPDA